MKTDQVDADKNLGNESADRKTEQRVLRELDADVAERVMGWSVAEYGLHNGDIAWLNDPSNYPHAETADDPEPYTGLLLWMDAQAQGVYWSPSMDFAAAMRVEDRIAELGKQNDYIAHLWDEVGAARDGANFWTAQNFNAFWLCVHATPEQRCRAALKAVECLSISDRRNDGQAS